MEIKDLGTNSSVDGNVSVESTNHVAQEIKAEPSTSQIEDGNELERVREVLRGEAASTKPTRPETLRSQVNAVKSKSSLVAKIFDRINFPSIHDKRKVLRAGYAAMEIATLSLLASKLAVDAAVAGMVSPELDWFAADSLRRITALSIMPMIASLAASYYVSAKEHFNKTLYGKTLTVTKVAASSTRKIQGLPVSDERFLGEMHFVGKGSFKNPLSFLVSDFFFKSESENLRHGITDLYALAEACSTNTPELEGVNVFFGVSPIVTRSLEKFGFQVMQYKDRRNLPERIVDAPLDAVNFITSIIPMRLRFKAHATQPNQMAVITRESLVENKDKIKKLMERLNRPQAQT